MLVFDLHDCRKEGMLFRKETGNAGNRQAGYNADGTGDSDMDAVMKNEIIKPHRPLDALTWQYALSLSSSNSRVLQHKRNCTIGCSDMVCRGFMGSDFNYMHGTLDYAKNRKIAKRNFEIEKGLIKQQLKQDG